MRVLRITTHWVIGLSLGLVLGNLGSDLILKLTGRF